MGVEEEVEVLREGAEELLENYRLTIDRVFTILHTYKRTFNAVHSFIRTSWWEESLNVFIEFLG